MQPTPLLDTIQHLWAYEKMLLHGQLLEANPSDEKATIAFLREMYGQESLNYPHIAPEFDENAALWGAKTLYIATQLLLNRTHNASDLPSLLPMYPTSSPSTMLSADLCLRFIPDLIVHVQAIDTEDVLLKLLNNLMQQWHYSGIAYRQEVETLDFSTITSDLCLSQLYVDRVIQCRRLPLAQHPVLLPRVQASLGGFTGVLWEELVGA